MEALRQRRSPLRATFTRTANALDDAVKSSDPDLDSLAALLAQLEEKGKRLAEVDDAYLRLMQGGECTQDEYEAEFTAIEVYSDRLIFGKTKVTRLLSKREESEHRSGSQDRDSFSHAVRRKYRLPEIELKKFGGDPKDWLGFWGQFKKIHDDDEVDSADKYQYLIQATVIGSRARELIESFPPSAENYTKAIESLKNRFGRDDTLVEVYVRELLRLVLSNALNAKQKVSLTVLYDKLESQLRALDTLGVTTDKYAAMLYPLVESCLPEDVMRAWERNRSFQSGAATVGVNEIVLADNRLSLLMNFLRIEVEGEERIHIARTGFGLETDSHRKHSKKHMVDDNTDLPTAAGLFNGQPSDTKHVGTNNKCVFCDRPHSSQDCRQAINMTLENKRKILLQRRCCFACLKTGHRIRTCRFKIKCTVCEKRHLALMCPEAPAHRSRDSPEVKPGVTPLAEQSVLASQTCPSEVLLQTLMVRLEGKHSNYIVRALIDSGSQRSYITALLAKALSCESLGEEKIVHNLFGGAQTSPRIHQRYSICLGNLNGDFRCQLEVLDQTTICGAIPKLKDGQLTRELKELGISLSDATCFPAPEVPQIQVLLGADVAGRFLTGRIQPLSCGPVAVETRLGWTLMGTIPRMQPNGDSTTLVTSLFVREAQVSDLWTLDSLGIRDQTETKTRMELQEAAWEHFHRTVTREADGRYEVALPWLDNRHRLPTNRRLAEKRLLSTVKKLHAEGQMQDYQSIFAEWKAEGIIEEVLPGGPSGNLHYLPHRPIFKETSETTKLRPVFDASARERDSPSLNDCLEKGPNLIELLPSVLNRFRLGEVGVVADIKKAFLQIGVRKEDRDHLRFLWCSNGIPGDATIFRHCRVVFGVSSSPFLLGAVLTHLLEGAPPHLKKTADRLRSSLYVDNCVASLETAAEVPQFIKESQELMASGMFDLRGWRFNQPEPPQQNMSKKDNTVPVLGLLWDIKEDTLCCDSRGLKTEVFGSITRRSILAAAHQVFDPLGFACAVMLCPKLLLQETWQLKTSWDSELPDQLAQRFRDWFKQLRLLDSVRIPRYLFGSRQSDERATLHVFCDASKLAYATCIYLRLETSEGVLVRFVQARARVAPLKAITIPRLELLACCIGARLAAVVRKDGKLSSIPTFYWSDATNALYWIKREDQWATFVWNRVQEIRSLSENHQWRHVPGSENPADLPSRGCTVEKLTAVSWWEGPAWLKRPEEEWPKSDALPDPATVEAERRKTVVAACSQQKDLPWYCQRFSSFLKVVRMIAWMFRFCNNARTDKTQRAEGELTVDETHSAEVTLLKVVQRDCFGSHVEKHLKALQPFKDGQGIVRVKTRLTMRRDTEDFRYPIVLPSDHLLVTLLIQGRHRELCHAGVQILMTDLREKYWILRSRRTIRRAIQRCGRCRRFLQRRVEVPTAPLPKDRVRDAAVFEVTGVDLAGPLFLRGGQRAWIVLFTCAVFRAVHLELVTSLSTEAFLQTLRRFVARRGRPRTIYSDNGTNFVGANNALRKLEDVVPCDVASRSIVWKFNPPTAAWWGGWWERLIGMVKQILRRVLGRASLNYEELATILCDCESVVNARPLTYVSEDVHDLVPLTPAMFLQEIRETGVPEVSVSGHAGYNKRLRYHQRLRENLRQRFRVEYLGQLRQASDKHPKSTTIEVGDVVLIGGDNVKRVDWPMARVLEVIPGRDGHVRVARLRTSSGELLRPVQRLYQLEAVREEREFLNSKHKPPTDVDPRVPERDAQETEVTTRSGRVVKPPERLQYI